MEKKLCIGDIVKLKDGTIGLVDAIDCYDADGYLMEMECILGKGCPLEKVYGYSLIRTNGGKTAWFGVEDYDCTMSEITKVLDFLNDVSSNEYHPDGQDNNNEDRETFIVDGVELECNKTYKAVQVVYDTPFCGTTETSYYIFPDGISEDYDVSDLFCEDDALFHAESYQYGFEDYLEQNVDGYDRENGEDYDTDCYWDDYETSVLENCYYEEIEICQADGDLDDSNDIHVLTPDGQNYKNSHRK